MAPLPRSPYTKGKKRQRQLLPMVDPWKRNDTGLYPIDSMPHSYVEDTEYDRMLAEDGREEGYAPASNSEQLSRTIDSAPAMGIYDGGARVQNTSVKADAPKAKVTLDLGPNRPKPPAQAYQDRLAQAVAAVNKDYGVTITSGIGQYGSPRHRSAQGLTADFKVTDENGNVIPTSDPRHPKIAASLVAHGFNEIGIGMTGGAFHAGYDTPGVGTGRDPILYGYNMFGQGKQAALAQYPEHIKAVQQQLKSMGLYDGPVDGIWGEGSMGAIAGVDTKSPWAGSNTMVAGGETTEIPGTEAAAFSSFDIAPQAQSTTGLPTDDEVREYFRQRAAQAGWTQQEIDDGISVLNREGLNPTSGGAANAWASTVDVGPNGDPFSFGPSQLNVNGGLGEVFQSETGLNPADPQSWKAQIDFTINQVSKGGWGPWAGAKAVGVTGKPANATQLAIDTISTPKATPVSVANADLPPQGAFDRPVMKGAFDVPTRTLTRTTGATTASPEQEAAIRDAATKQRWDSLTNASDFNAGIEAHGIDYRSALDRQAAISSKIAREDAPVSRPAGAPAEAVARQDLAPQQAAEPPGRRKPVDMTTANSPFAEPTYTGRGLPPGASATVDEVKAATKKLSDMLRSVSPVEQVANQDLAPSSAPEPAGRQAIPAKSVSTTSIPTPVQVTRKAPGLPDLAATQDLAPTSAPEPAGRPNPMAQSDPAMQQRLQRAKEMLTRAVQANQQQAVASVHDYDGLTPQERAEVDAILGPGARSSFNTALQASKVQAAQAGQQAAAAARPVAPAPTRPVAIAPDTLPQARTAAQQAGAAAALQAASRPPAAAPKMPAQAGTGGGVPSQTGYGGMGTPATQQAAVAGFQTTGQRTPSPAPPAAPASPSVASRPTFDVPTRQLTAPATPIGAGVNVAKPIQPGPPSPALSPAAMSALTNFGGSLPQFTGVPVTSAPTSVPGVAVATSGILGPPPAAAPPVAAAVPAPVAPAPPAGVAGAPPKAPVYQQPVSWDAPLGGRTTMGNVPAGFGGDVARMASQVRDATVSRNTASSGRYSNMVSGTNDRGQRVSSYTDSRGVQHNTTTIAGRDYYSRGDANKGGSVLCTYFYRKGRLPRRVWQLDTVWSARNIDDVTYWGYRAWADRLIKVMRGRPRLQAVVWHAVVKPWAYEVTGTRKTLLGKLVRRTLEPLSYLIGRMTHGDPSLVDYSRQ
jgi:hypothetical protein